MKYAFNESLPYVTHLVVLHPFTYRPQTFLTIIRYLTLIKSNLIKQEKISLLFRTKFKQFHTFSAYSKLQCVFTLYVHYYCDSFENSFCAVTFVNSFS